MFLFLTQAEEQNFNKRYATAIINTDVMPQDKNKPYISSAKVGYIYENAVVTTLVLNQNLDAPLQIKISDNDLVSNFMNSSEMKYSNEVQSILFCPKYMYV